MKNTTYSPSELPTNRYILACHKQPHPCNDILSTTSPPTNIRMTAKNFPNLISNVSITGIVLKATYKTSLKSFHTMARNLDSYKPNRVINDKPFSPKIKFCSSKRATTQHQMQHKQDGPRNDDECEGVAYLLHSLNTEFLNFQTMEYDVHHFLTL